MPRSPREASECSIQTELPSVSSTTRPDHIHVPSQRLEPSLQPQVAGTAEQPLDEIQAPNHNNGPKRQRQRQPSGGALDQPVGEGWIPPPATTGNAGQHNDANAWRQVQQQQGDDGDDDMMADPVRDCRQSSSIEELLCSDPVTSRSGRNALQKEQFNMFMGLWYTNNCVEQQFLIHELPKNRFRLVCFCVAFTFVGLYYLATVKAQDLMWVVLSFGIVSGVLAIADCLVLWRFKTISEQLEQSAKDRKESPTRQKDWKKEKFAERELHRVRQTCAFIHEVLGVFCAAAIFIVTTVLYRIRQRECSYLTDVFDGREDNENCPFDFYGVYVFGCMIPVAIGQPRAFILVVFSFISAVTLPFIVVFHHNRSALSPVILYALLYVVMSLIIYFKLVDENRHRRLFESDITLKRRAKELKQRHKAFQDFAFEITPLHLRRSLLLTKSSASTAVSSFATSVATGASSIVPDISLDAGCLLVDIDNVVKFVTSMMPSQAANLIGLFNAQVYEKCKELPAVHHIRTIGDTNYIVCNLFKANNNIAPSSITTTEQELVAVSKMNGPQINSAADAAITQLILCAVTLLDASSSDIPVRCAISRGLLVGMPLGESCIRYDIHGDALDQARSLSLLCPVDTTIVCEDVAKVAGLYPAFEVRSIVSEPTPSSSVVTVCNKSELLMMMEDAVNGVDCTVSSGSPTSSSEMSIGDANVDVSRVTNFVDAQVRALHVSEERGERSNEEDEQQPPPVEAEPEAASLELYNSCHCCLPVFLSKPTEISFQHDALIKAKTPFTVTHVFFALIGVLAFCSIAEERQGRSQEATLLIGFCINVVCTISFAALAAVAKVKPAYVHRTPTSPPQDAVPGYLVLCSYATCLLSLIGINLSRPSSVGDDPASFVFVFMIAAVITGGTIRQSLIFSIMCAVLFYLMHLIFRPVPEAILIGGYPFFFAVLFNTMILRNGQERELFRSYIKTQETLEEVRKTQRIREGVISALIPRQLRNQLTAETIKQQSLESWSCDEAVVIHLTCNTMPSAAADALLKQAVKNKDREGAATRAFCATLRSHHDAMTKCIETAIAASKNQRLDIVKIFGGAIFLAGPFSAPTDTSTSASDTVVAAICDAFDVLTVFLQQTAASQRNRAIYQQQRNASVTSDSQEDRWGQTPNNSDPLLEFTAGCAVEQIVNVLRLTEYPSYEMLGSAVNHSKAISLAAPTGFAGISEKMASMYHREASPDIIAENATKLTIGAPESWRLRGIGSVRVCGVRLAQMVPPTGVATTSVDDV